MTFLSIFDLFKTPVFLTFEKNIKTSTNFGVFFSFGLIIFLSVNFFQSDVFYKTSPKVMIHELLTDKRSLISFRNKIFTVSVEDTYAKAFYDPQIFQVRITNLLVQTEQQENYKLIKNQTKNVHKCTPQDFPDDLYYTNSFENNFCLDDAFFETEGYWNENLIGYLDINIGICNNETFEGKCKTFEEIKEFFDDDKYFNVYYSSSNSDTSNYLTPLSSFIINDYSKIDFAITKVMNIYLKNIDINTDDAFIFSNNEKIEDVIFDSKEVDFFMSKDIAKENPIFECNFYSSSNRQIIQRVYQKMSEALANLGGIANFMMFFGFLLTSLEKDLYMKKKVMNDLYSFQNPKLLKKKKKSISNETLSKDTQPIRSKKDKNMERKLYTQIPKAISRAFKSAKEGKKTEGNGNLPILQNGLQEIETITKKSSVNILNYCNSPNYLIPKTVPNDPPNDSKNDDNNEQIPIHIVERNDQKTPKFNHRILNSQKEYKNLDKEIENFTKKSSVNILNYCNSPNYLIPKTVPNDSPNDSKNDDNNEQIPIHIVERNDQKKTHPTFNQRILDSLKRKIIKKHEKIKNVETFLKSSTDKPKLTFTIFEYMKLNLKQIFHINLSAKEKLFVKGVEIYSSELDVVSILKKLQEIEKLKLILFNSKQMMLFNLLDKPLIYLENTDENKEEEDKFDPSKIMSKCIIKATDFNLGELKKVFEYFERLEKNSGMSEIDKRLMELIDNNVTKFIHNFQ